MRATWLLALLPVALLAACTGPTGDPGPTGPRGTDGADGEQGEPGEPGADGMAGGSGGQGPQTPSAYLTGPGLDVEILSATIDETTARVEFRLTDDSGLPLDREGLFTEGAVNLSFNLGYLEEQGGEPGQYVAFTTREQTSPITNDTATQPSADTDGVFEDVDLFDGVYAYELATPIVVTQPSFTHTVGMWASRDVGERRYVDDGVFNFRPDGMEVTTTREVVKTDTCNGCHNPLALHGERRRKTELCVTCHTAGVVDPDTGNTVDLKVMIHKIHRGHELPSVEGGTPYQIIGFNQSVHDYSTVAFPQPVQQCETCHTGKDGDFWKERPSRLACGSCHDDISFAPLPVPAGTVAHPGGPQADDANCLVCHGEGVAIAGVDKFHWTQFTDPDRPVLNVQIVSVENTGPNQTPELVFTVELDGSDPDIITNPLTSLRVTVAGPTTDYAEYWQHTIQGNGATGTLAADPAGYRYTFPAPMPVSASGSFGFGMEGYVQPVANGPRYATFNPVTFAAVTDSQVVPRRTVVEASLCNSCHYQLSLHGGSRTNPNYCVMCHNPNNYGDERYSKFEDDTTIPPSVHFKVMVHKIHMGERLTQQPYLVGGFPVANAANPGGNLIDFGEVRFPGDISDCATCHVGTSFMLPLPATALPTLQAELTCVEDPAADGDDFCNSEVITDTVTWGPAASACISCHDSPDTEAHAWTMTAANGAEACATCHGPGDAFDAALGHMVDQ